ncbi:MAG: hypothetical protein RLZZ253_2419, partial [Verrucomicrobiota bacterium]
ARLGRTHQIALHTLARSLFDFLTTEQHVPPEIARTTLLADWNRAPGREALRLDAVTPDSGEVLQPSRRQARHAGTAGRA